MSCSVDTGLRWADAPYQYLADQKALDLSFPLTKGGGCVTVSQRVDSLATLGCTGAVVWDGAVVMARCLESWAAAGALPPAPSHRGRAQQGSPQHSKRRRSTAPPCSVAALRPRAWLPLRWS
jgi:hypothetical protein